MIFLLVGAVAFLVLFILLGFDTARAWRIRFRQILALFAFFALSMFGCFASVPTGYTGIVTTFGKVEDTTLEAGFHTKLPWQEIVTMDNREQRELISIGAFSSDIQQVDLTGSINYSINKSTAMTLYKEVGKNYYTTLIQPRLYENAKAVFSKYTAENLVSKREVLSSQISELVQKDLQRYGINIVSVAIENLDFTDAFTNAVEAKQVAAQNKLTAETQQAQMTMEAQAAASRKIIEANAAAEVTKIEAEVAQYAGEKEAEMNKKLAESLTAELVEYYYAQKWNGILPATFVGSEESIPVLNIPTEPAATTNP